MNTFIARPAHRAIVVTFAKLSGQKRASKHV